MRKGRLWDAASAASGMSAERMREGREDDERPGFGEEWAMAHAREEAKESREEKRGGGGGGGGRGPAAAGRRPGGWRRGARGG
jgi:hypothetical protein